MFPDPYVHSIIPASNCLGLDFFLKNRYNSGHVERYIQKKPLLIYLSRNNGGYGVTVNTEVCGAFDSGSIPDSRPEKERNAKTPRREFLRF